MQGGIEEKNHVLGNFLRIDGCNGEAAYYLTYLKTCKVLDTYGIALSIASTHRLMIKMGIKRLKAASFPENADPEKQKAFYDEILFPLMKDALNNKIHLLFMDGAHFVMGCDFLGYIYGSTRRFVHSHSGRQRYNVLGAIDFVTKKVHTVTNKEYLTATQVMEMMRKVVAYYGPDKPIRIILDNARYQTCAAVMDLKKSFRRNTTLIWYFSLRIVQTSI